MITNDSPLFHSLRRRYKTQKALKGPFERLLDEIDYYTGPLKEAGATAGVSAIGQQLQARKDLWDFTAIEGRERLAATIQVGAFNSVLRWILLSWRIADLNRDQEAQKWLSDRAEEAWGDVQDSDYNVEIGSFLDEWSGPGHAFIGMEPMPPGIEERRNARGELEVKPKWRGVDFTAIPLRESYFEEDRRGGLRTFWRRHDWTAAQIIDFCEDKGLEVPEDVSAAYEKGDDSVIEIVCAYFLNAETAKADRIVYPLPIDKRPWRALWWREDRGTVLHEDGYYEQPVYFSRYAKTPGSKWGHGPATIALPTVKYVNAMLELIHAVGEKALEPTVLTDERNLLSDMDHRPASLVLCRDPSRTVVLESKARFDVGEQRIADDRAMIRKIFHTDDLELKDSPAMTATEAQIRYEWMQRLLGKSLTSLQNDAIGPMIVNLIRMRIRLGASPDMPAKARQLSDGEFNIEYQGPLARSMRTDEVAAIERGATFVAGLAQFYPEVRAKFDPMRAVDHVFQRLGMPADMIPPEAEVRRRVQEILAAQERAMAAESAAKEAKAAADTAKARSTPIAAGPLPIPPPTAGTQYPELPPRPYTGLDGRTA